MSQSFGAPPRLRSAAIRLLGLVGLLCLFLAGFPLPAAGAGLQFDVFLGYGDNKLVHEGCWFPVACEILNDGPSFDATFELSNEIGGRTQVRHLAIELPTNTRKRFVIPCFASGGRYSRWTARLLDEHGKVRAEQANIQAKDRAWSAFILGALPRSFGGLPGFPESKSRQEDLQPAVARLQVDHFPDNPIALEGLSAMYLNSEKALELKVNQVGALLAWLHGGGHLILAVEQLADINGTPWLQNIVPCELTGVSTVQLDGQFHRWLQQPFLEQGGPAPPESTTQPFRASRRNLARDRANPNAPSRNPAQNADARAAHMKLLRLEADVAFDTAQLPVATGRQLDSVSLVSVGDVPLVIQAARGRGLVTLLPFSPEREPFRSWTHRDWFWAKVSGIEPVVFESTDYNRYGGSSVDGIIGAMIDSEQVRKLPVTWLLLLLVVYLAVIGPLDQYWLKKAHRQMWTWVTFPAYVAVFSGLIYFIGYKLRAGESEWNELHYVDILPRGERAELRGRTFASVYSPVNAKYELAAEQPHATLRSEFQGSWSGGQESSRASVEQRAKGFRAEILVPVWTSQMYVSDWLQPADLPLWAEINSRGSSVELKVENRLDQKLVDARLALKGRIHELGDLAARETKTFSLNTDSDSSGIAIGTFIENYRNTFFHAVQSRRQALGDDRRGRLELDAAHATAACLVSETNPDTRNNPQFFLAPAGFDVGPLLDRGQAVLFAWTPDYSPIAPINRFSPRRLHRDSLLRLSVPMPMKEVQ